MKRMIYSSLGFFLLLLSLNFVSANFLCGEVNSTQRDSPAWLDVRVYYLEKPQMQMLCEVSPSSRKYCCDPLDIKNATWAIGKGVGARILDFENGYFSAEVNATISGAGYDLFPVLNLIKVIEINSPNSEVYVNQSKILINLTFNGGFGANVSYNLSSLNFSKNEIICSNCSSAVFYLENLSTGDYELRVFASNGVLEMNENISFGVYSTINFSRYFSCERCRKNSVPSMTEVNVTLVATSQSNLNGVLSDYFPAEWVVLDGGEGVVEPYSKTHNKISWNVSGRNIKKMYRVLSPRVFLPARYDFRSGFEGYFGSIDSVRVFRFFRLPFSLFFNRFTQPIDEVYSVTYAKVSQENPIILSTINDSDVYGIIVYPDYSRKKASLAFVRGAIPQNLENVYDAFYISTNVYLIRGVELKIRIPLDSGETVSLHKYDYSRRKWSNVSLKFVSKDEEYEYYTARSETIGFFALTEKN